MDDALGRRQLAALVEAGMALASELDLDPLLQKIADLSREVIGARFGAVGIVDTSGSLTRFVHSGIDQATVERIGHLPEGRGLLGVIIEEGRPLRLRDIRDHPRSAGFPEHHPPMRSFLGVPITGRTTIYGRLYLTEKHDGSEFSKDDERLALMFAAQAGVAIENAQLYEEVQARGNELAQRVAELASVERVGHLLISEGSIDEALDVAAEESGRLTEATLSLLMLLEPTSGDLIVRAVAADERARGLELRPGAEIPSGTSKAHAVIRRKRAEIADRLSEDPEVHRATIEKLGSPRWGAFIPLETRGEPIGVLAVYRHEGGAFDQDDLAVLQIMANQAAIAVENDRLTEALRDLAVLEERERISKELHDGVIQTIYSVGLHLQGSMSLLERDPKKAGERIDQAIEELDNVVRDVRSYIFELLPKQVREVGLKQTIERLVRDVEVNALVHGEVAVPEAALDRLSRTQQSYLMQIVREILSNIARHSQATEVSIHGGTRDGEFVLVVDDNGVGFDPTSVTRGHGLDNMQQRAEKLGGAMAIERLAPTGMRHTLRFPIAATEAR